MAAVAIAAEGWVFTWDGQPIEGIDSFTLSMEEKLADTTTFDNVASESHLKIRTARTLKLSGRYFEDGANQATGQAKIEASALLAGSAAEETCIITSPGGRTIQFTGTAKMDDIGGGNDDATSWGCTITRTGVDA